MGKTVLITTMHRGNNYGSALQVYALSEKIKDIGSNPIVLDYVPDRINNKKTLITLFRNLLCQNSKNEVYQTIRAILIIITTNKCYNRFFKRNLKLTRKYLGFNSLDGKLPEADIYMTGSDQVWNSIHNQGIDPVFYMKYAPDDKPKVAYAASFGREKLDEWEVEETKKLLERYEKISVREFSGLNILKSIGIDDAVHVLDPTFLLNAEEWRERSISNKQHDKYVLIYSVEPDKNSIIKIAKEIADSINAKVYMVEWGVKCYPGVDKMVSCIDPLMLIDYFDKAEFVVASSFHGTALSLNLNKQFISITPTRFNTRVESILDLVGLKHRLVAASEFSIGKALQMINYNEVNSKLTFARDQSMKYLKSILS